MLWALGQFCAGKIAPPTVEPLWGAQSTVNSDALGPGPLLCWQLSTTHRVDVWIGDCVYVCMCVRVCDSMCVPICVHEEGEEVRGGGAGGEGEEEEDGGVERKQEPHLGCGEKTDFHDVF